MVGVFVKVLELFGGFRRSYVVVFRFRFRRLDIFRVTVFILAVFLGRGFLGVSLWAGVGG